MVNFDSNTKNIYSRMKIESIFFLLLSEDASKVRILMFCNKCCDFFVTSVPFLHMDIEEISKKERHFHTNGFYEILTKCLNPQK